MSEHRKAFEDLTPEELAELEARDWSAGEILRAIHLALKAHDIEATTALMLRLAVKDPKAAAALFAVIEATP